MHSHAYIEASHTRKPTRFRLCFQQLFDYLHEYLQPWFKADVEAILAEPDIATLRSGRFVGMHIRRTDKQIYDGAALTETEVKNVTACRLLVPSGKLSNQFATTPRFGDWLVVLSWGGETDLEHDSCFFVATRAGVFR